MKIIAAIACTALLASGVALAPLATRQAVAAEAIPNVDTPGLVLETLKQQLSKRVKVKLISGQDLEGKVARVGTSGIVLTELTGMDYYEATVRLDQIAALIVRSAGK
jgi:hypothetical protein